MENSFRSIYKDILDDGKIVSPRGLKVMEVKNYEYMLPPYTRFANFESRKLSLDYIKTEFMWYLRGEPTDTSITHSAKIWERMVNPRGEIPSNYGQYIFKKENGTCQFDYVVEELTKDPDSRRASISILQKANVLSGNADLPCTYAINFSIRENELNMTVHMRSQDAILGLGNDVPTFSFIQEMVYESLREVYPLLNMGWYTHFVDSLHVYEKHFPMLVEIVKWSKYEKIEIPKISGLEEVKYLRGLDYTSIPPEYEFTKWLTQLK